MHKNAVAATIKIRSVFLMVAWLLSACAKARILPPLVVTALPAEPLSTDTSSLPAATPLLSTDTPIPAPTRDLHIFGAIGTGDIQAQALETVANAIFKKTMDGLVAGGSVTEYQVTGVTVLPGDENLLAEITYNVKTKDASWLADGGIQTADGWIKGDCSRFDIVITDTEFELTKRRACS